MPALTSADLARTILATYKRVDKSRVQKVDRKKRPWKSFLHGKKEMSTFEGGAIIYPIQVSFNQAGTTWQGDDELEAQEPDFQLNLEYSYFNYNYAIQIKHDLLTRLGYSITPNGQGALAERVLTRDQISKIIPYVKQLVEGAMDNAERDLDVLYHLPGTAKPTDPVGLAAFLNTTPATGTTGGLDRALYPAVRPGYDSSSAIAAGSDFRRDFTRILRSANLYSSSGGVAGEVDFMMAGQAFIDGYTYWAELNNYQLNRDISGVRKVDISIPDSAVHFEGVPIVHDPTLDTLDSAGLLPGASKYCYGINSSSWKFKVLPGKDLVASSPMDAPKTRITRADVDLTAHIACDAPASNFLFQVA